MPLFAEQVFDVVATQAPVVCKPALQLGRFTVIGVVKGTQTLLASQAIKVTVQVGPLSVAFHVVEVELA